MVSLKRYPMKRLEIYIDGASKGNPGPSSIGVIICRDGKTIKNIARYIGNATNNAAEYTALIFALQEALALGAESVNINTDSQLLCRQVRKIYRVRNAGIAKLYNKAVGLMDNFKEVNVKHLPRHENVGADKLANIAVRKGIAQGYSLLDG